MKTKRFDTESTVQIWNALHLMSGFFEWNLENKADIRPKAIKILKIS